MPATVRCGEGRFGYADEFVVPGVFIEFDAVGIDLIEVRWILDVYLTRIDSNNWAYDNINH